MNYFSCFGNFTAHHFVILLASFVLISCGPQKESLSTPQRGGETLEVGCGPQTGIVMNCRSDDGSDLGSVTLDVHFNCSSDLELTSVNVNTDLGGSGLACAISNPVFEKGSSILNSIVGMGGSFSGDSALKTLPVDKMMEWSCVENYQDDLTRDLNRFFHFITFKKSGNKILGLLENRYEYVDYDQNSQKSASSCTFEYAAD